MQPLAVTATIKLANAFEALALCRVAAGTSSGTIYALGLATLIESRAFTVTAMLINSYVHAQLKASVPELADAE